MCWVFLIIALCLPNMLQAKAVTKAVKHAPLLSPGPAPLEMQQLLGALVKAAGGNRTVGLEGNTRAYDWLLAQARRLQGWEVVEYPFMPDVDFALNGYRGDFEPFSRQPENAIDYIRGKRALDSLSGFAESLRGKKLQNLILRKKGGNPSRAKELLVVSAHFDTMTNRREPFEVFPKAPAPGADNNGAAVVALLYLAKALQTLKPATTLELVFTNAGEAYYLGAHAYAQELMTKGIEARNISLNMIGWDEPEKDRLNLYVRTEGKPGFERDTKLAVVAGNELLTAGLKAVVIRRNADRSEHWAFWQSFHAATLISQDWEYGFNDSHYHSPTDTPESVDWKFVSKITKGLELAVRKLVE